MRCSNCGESIPENSVFCPFCGYKLSIRASTKRSDSLQENLSRPTCRYPDCEFIAEHKCETCGDVFCIKHIAYFKAGWLHQWICIGDLRATMESQRRVAAPATTIGMIGVVMMMIGIGATNNLYGGFWYDFGYGVMCVGMVVAGIGLGVGLGFGLRYKQAKSFLERAFPDAK